MIDRVMGSVIDIHGGGWRGEGGGERGRLNVGVGKEVHLA
jgi:hypothetical protein